MCKFKVLAAAAVLGGTGSVAFAEQITLTGTIRDFRGVNEIGGHLDFENEITGWDPGIVQSVLSADGKPVYAGQAGNPSTHGQAAFDLWYRDAPGVNMAAPLSITLDNGGAGSVYTFSDSTFFPIDGQLFGNTPGWGHNYHFTFELHTTFNYQAGQSFTFTGDDDVWVFINDQLVIDLGGVHGAMTQSVDLDTLGLTAGNNYDLDFFFAERHTTASNFRIDTSIPLVAQTPVVPLPAAAWGGMALLGGLGATKRLRRRRDDTADVA